MAHLPPHGKRPPGAEMNRSPVRKGRSDKEYDKLRSFKYL